MSTTTNKLTTKNTKSVLEIIKPSNDAMLKMQVKINTWATTGLLIKYQVHTQPDYVLFQILLRKEVEPEVQEKPAPVISEDESPF